MTDSALRIIVNKATFLRGSAPSELGDGSRIFLSFCLSADDLFDEEESPVKLGNWGGESAIQWIAKNVVVMHYSL